MELEKFIEADLLRIFGIAKFKGWQPTNEYRIKKHIMFIHGFPSYEPQRKWIKHTLWDAITHKHHEWWIEIPKHKGCGHFWNDYEDALADIHCESPAWTESQEQKEKMARRAQEIEDEKQANMNLMLGGTPFSKLKWTKK